MAEVSRLTLHGFFLSPYSRRVELALKLKGIPYEYVEEDLKNKSPLLLKYNPVHNKVPVLVHNGQPIAESLVILEYIDETWKEGPKLLPEDPYKRARVRFWTYYVHQQLFEIMLTVLKTEGERQQKAVKELHEKLEVLEGGIKEFFPKGTACIDSEENIGMLDLVMTSFYGAFKVNEEVLGVTIIDPEKLPLIYSWITSMMELPLVKEAIPPHDKMVGHLRFIRQRALQTPTA